MINHIFKNKLYVNIPPQADSMELAEKYERIMFRHNKWDEPTFFLAPKDILNSGYVIGLVVGEE